MPTSNKPTPRDIDCIIRANLGRLTKPGALTVRPGYEIASNQLTGRAAIVVTVHTKRAALRKADLLPDSIARIPVDVREATAYQRLRAHDPAAAELASAYGRPENKEPTWDYERELPGGRRLDDKSSATPKALAYRMANQPATARALSAHAKKPEIAYVPAPGVALAPLALRKATITAHVSPDAGLATLQSFLGGTRKALQVGMYDFTSGTILQTFQSALGGRKTLHMVLDNPAPNATRDQTDTQTVEQLDAALGSRAGIARALDRQDVFAAAWMFPYAYHIKVIVRDLATTWLSSGNLNNSNQPDLKTPPQIEDRDWHVIIEDKPLAALFAAFLDQDYASASAHQAAPADRELERAVVDAHAKLAAEANPPVTARMAPTKAGYVAAKVFENVDVTITPLLTPDKLAGSTSQGQYLAAVLALIESAQQSLYIQLQYIEASKGSGDYDALLRAIAGRIAAGVDVRLIESAEYGMKWAEKMKQSGVDLTRNIRLQSNVHNKGFVVDSKQVVISSQNFSSAGIAQNRDAGVIIASESIAAYYEAVFLADWEKRAKPFVASTAIEA
ncbi:phospholipase D-like domain-containing protein [Paraburkholderia lycopersici]|uniref:phospholipase D n=1 Tax=Paraburkholderia lycopersici TaxID=416944 RepID=A0A1G6QDN2_9BURK|nr:phospholipase D-like domain-containing protein [Paraburkholderia lycopersici]SDC90413.1 Phosphatidylserine/phosphatidylglycerophosphate/cardiolipin synthase [Paraburkholderia lycopersici]